MQRRTIQFTVLLQRRIFLIFPSCNESLLLDVIYLGSGVSPIFYSSKDPLAPVPCASCIHIVLKKNKPSDFHIINIGLCVFLMIFSYKYITVPLVGSRTRIKVLLQMSLSLNLLFHFFDSQQLCFLNLK